MSGIFIVGIDGLSMNLEKFGLLRFLLSQGLRFMLLPLENMERMVILSAMPMASELPYREHIYENGTCLGCQEHIGPLITKQPVSCEVALGERFTFTVEAEGEGLSYQWYYKDSYMKEFRISSFKSSTYAMTMANYHNNRQVYCVITDMNGNSVQTEVATIYLET